MKKILLLILNIIAIEIHAAGREEKQEEPITFKEMLKSPKQQPQTDTDDKDFDGFMLPKPPTLDHDYDNLLAQNPIKFKAALRRMTTRRSQLTRGRHHAMLDRDAQRAEIQEAIQNLRAINDRLHAHRNELDREVETPWNRERKKDLAKTGVWCVAAGVLAYAEIHFFTTKNADPNAAISNMQAGVGLAPVAVTAFNKFVGSFDAVYSNNNIDKQLEESNKKIAAVKELKRELLEEIDSLHKQDQNLQDRVSALEARLALVRLTGDDAE